MRSTTSVRDRRREGFRPAHVCYAAYMAKVEPPANPRNLVESSASGWASPYRGAHTDAPARAVGLPARRVAVHVGGLPVARTRWLRGNRWPVRGLLTAMCCRSGDSRHRRWGVRSRRRYSAAHPQPQGLCVLDCRPRCWIEAGLPRGHLVPSALKGHTASSARASVWPDPARRIEGPARTHKPCPQPHPWLTRRDRCRILRPLQADTVISSPWAKRRCGHERGLPSRGDRGCPMPP